MDEQRGNLCPECNGACYQVYWSWEYDEWCDGEYCPACFGAGTIDTIPTEEDVSLSRLVYHIMPGPYGPTKVYREDVAEYNEWLDSLR